MLVPPLPGTRSLLRPGGGDCRGSAWRWRWGCGGGREEGAGSSGGFRGASGTRDCSRGPRRPCSRAPAPRQPLPKPGFGASQPLSCCLGPQGEAAGPRDDTPSLWPLVLGRGQVNLPSRKIFAGSVPSLVK